MTLVPSSSRSSGGGAISGVTITGTAAAGDVPIASSSSAGTWALPSGFEFDYVENTAGLSVTATTEGAAQNFISGNAVTYDGATRIKVEFYANNANSPGSSTTVVILQDGSTSLGWLIQVGSATSPPVYAARFLTPSAGAHTYHIAAWRTSSNGALGGGAGGSGNQMPSWYRITKA